jgi:hypothetical protein
MVVVQEVHAGSGEGGDNGRRINPSCDHGSVAVFTCLGPAEFPFAQRTRMDETGMVGAAGREIGSVLV